MVADASRPRDPSPDDELFMTDADTRHGHGLPMVTPPDPDALAAEERWLAEVEQRGTVRRTLAYLARGGPGYLQSALTLGGGSASASLLAGAAFGYELIWVPFVGMAIGVIMLSAVAHQTLSTGMRPFDAMRVHAGPVFAYGWALGALLSSVVWHFSQYSLASAVVVDIGDALEQTWTRPAAGAAILVWSLITSQMFGGRSRLGRLFDGVLKLLIWTIVACFGLVVVKTGGPDWSALWRGFTSFTVPDDVGDVSGLALVISGLAAAVVVNMVFLYPYTLLARGWGRLHRRLARVDLFAGMLVPYVLATGLMIVATANTVHAAGTFSGTGITPLEASATLAEVLGPAWGRVVFNAGILGMVLTTITMHMVCAGFACGEMFGWTFGSTKTRLAMLLPTPGVLGCVYWSDLSVWVAVPTSILSGFMLPLAYVGFLKLQRSAAYLGDDRPTGARGAAWLGGMMLATLVIVVFLAWYLVTKGPGFLDQLLGGGA